MFFPPRLKNMHSTASLLGAARSPLTRGLKQEKHDIV
jgi:hypothetical protein